LIAIRPKHKTNGKIFIVEINNNANVDRLPSKTESVHDYSFLKVVA